MLSGGLAASGLSSAAALIPRGGCAERHSGPGAVSGTVWKSVGLRSSPRAGRGVQRLSRIRFVDSSCFGTL